jgi:hypothetical protein
MTIDDRHYGLRISLARNQTIGGRRSKDGRWIEREGSEMSVQPQRCSNGLTVMTASGIAGGKPFQLTPAP